MRSLESPKCLRYTLLVALGVVCGLGVAAGLQCPTHPVPTHGFSVCPKGKKHRSMCETKCKNGYRLKGPSMMMCWCKAGKCTWNGVRAKCEKMKCDMPDVESGTLRFADTWTGGFAAIVEMQNIVPTSESDFGWSVVIVFNKPLGKKATLLSWNLDLTATSYDGQTFTFVNPEKQTKLSAILDSKGRFSAVIVAESVEGSNPDSVFVGLYYRRVRDATCVMAPRMPDIRGLYSEEKMSPTTPTNPPTTTKRPTTTKAATVPTTRKTTTKKPQPHRTKPGANKREKPATKTTTSKITEASSTTVMPTTTTVPTTTTEKNVVATTLIADGSFCVVQKHEEYFITEKGWEDRGQLYFSGDVAIESRELLPDWRIVIVFTDAIKAIETWACRVVDNSEDGLIWTLGPHPWNTNLYRGRKEIRFIATQSYATVGLPSAQVFLCSETFTAGDAVIGGAGLGLGGPTESPRDTAEITTSEITTTPTSSNFKCSAGDPAGRPIVRSGQTKPDFKPNKDGTKYNYNEVLHKSILFYEAQRSGRLPQNNRIPWRGDSALKDGCDIQVDLTGGWFDAGDCVKFSFPMAYSLTTLAWGGILFRDAYQDAGELENMIQLIKWPVKYFIKSHISKYELVGQVGHGQTDHNYWGRPEEMQMKRPTYTISDKKPGTELAAEVAAALAASSIFLKSSDPDLAEEALAHAKQLFELADEFRASYHVNIPDAALYYKSYSGYNDELVWSAAWLYKATNDSKYLTSAEKLYERMSGKYTTAKEFSWDDKLAGAQALLADMTGSADYRRPFLQFLNNLPNRKKTPQGLLYLGDWGTNRYAANAAFMLIVGSRLRPFPPKRAQYLKMAEKQIGLLLGDAGRSYVVGFGFNPPKRAHHGSSSCPEYPERCDWSIYQSPRENHYILYGALVGGPNQKGVYGDHRSIFQETEVACDYNAGFQSAVAGLKYNAMRKRQAAETTTTTTTTATTTTTTQRPATTKAKRSSITSPPSLTTKKSRTPCRPWRSRRCVKLRAARKSKAKS